MSKSAIVPTLVEELLSSVEALKDYEALRLEQKLKDPKARPRLSPNGQDRNPRLEIKVKAKRIYQTVDFDRKRLKRQDGFIELLTAWRTVANRAQFKLEDIEASIKEAIELSTQYNYLRGESSAAKNLQD